MSRYLIVILIFLTSTNILAKAQYEPIIDNYGPVYEVKNQDTVLPKGHHYKVVFDVYKTASELDVHSRRLESVARFINMHALKNVPMENMHIAVVFHGKATKDILTDSAYQALHQMDNPNSELIEALADNGVKLYVCGQTVDFFKHHRKDILPDVKIALSAMTQLAIYQSKG
ncbi:MAG: DsrE family protein, partial [Enterobacterales bacterium]|nr:DsrE family protein [Enterobacterales bacterium]